MDAWGWKKNSQFLRRGKIENFALEHRDSMPYRPTLMALTGHGVKVLKRKSSARPNSAHQFPTLLISKRAKRRPCSGR